jgi:hypothetical protein
VLARQLVCAKFTISPEGRRGRVTYRRQQDGDIVGHIR